MPDEYPHIKFEFEDHSDEEMIRAGEALYKKMDQRRSVRFYSKRPVPRRCIEAAIRAASTAPSGAHMQPWTWVVIDDPELKRRIRIAAENEERENYEGGRMSQEWLEALAPLGTDWRKPFLEHAPYIVVCFQQRYGFHPDGRKKKHYYTAESVGIACGFFIAAIHEMGLVTLTHTPSPMRFLNELLRRPANESPFILFPIGYPADDATVPDLERKPLDRIISWNDGSKPK